MDSPHKEPVMRRFVFLSYAWTTSCHTNHRLTVDLKRHDTYVAVMRCHYNDVIMSAMASQIASLTSVYSTVYSGADQRKHQRSASLAFVVTGEVPEMASNAENVSIRWRHHVNPFQMSLSRRQGRLGTNLKGMAWDEMALAPLETSSIIFNATEVYRNGRNGFIEIEIYTGTSQCMLREYITSKHLTARSSDV